MEHSLPLVTRWTLYALGAVEGQRVRRPRDPVAAWMLRRHPRLLPTFAAPSILAMIRSRSGAIDRLIEEELHSTRRQQRRLSFWSVGGGFDARWYRLRPIMEDVLAEHHEVDLPEVLSFKDQVLAKSSYAKHWGRVHAVPADSSAWVASPSEHHTLIVLEGVASRLGVETLRRQLKRIRRESPAAHVILDIPGMLPSRAAPPTLTTGGTRTRWQSALTTSAAAIKTRELVHMGWSVHTDLWQSARPQLRAHSGMPVCAGLEAFRVLKLTPTPS